MTRNIHDHIHHIDEIGIINSPAFYDSVVHIICTAGQCKFNYNGVKFDLSPDNLAVITDPRGVSAVEWSQDFQCEIIIAPEEYLHSLLPASNYSIAGRVSLYANPIITMSPDQTATLLNDMKLIGSRLCEHEHLYYIEMIGSLLRTLIYDIFDIHARHNENPFVSGRASYVTKRFFAMIQEGFPATRREPSFYADELNVSVKYLSETIKRVSGDSVSRHINRAAVAIILDYLKDDSLSITQIADLMNFSSVQYFSRYCVKHLGHSPSHLR